VLALIVLAEDVRHPGLVIAAANQRSVGWRNSKALATTAAGAFGAVTLVQGFLTFGAAQVQTPREFAITTLALLPSVLLGSLVTWRVPDSLVGPALCWVGAAPALVAAVESWGDTLLGPHPWPGATAVFILKQGFWVWNLAGFVALCLVFPDGPLSGRFWRRLPLLAVGAACLLNAAVSLDPDSHRVDGEVRAGYALHLPTPLRVFELACAFGFYLFVLGATVASLVVRYRRSGEVARLQLRWLLLSAGVIPALLILGWIADAAGMADSAYVAFMVVMLVAVPVAVAIAILRYDLYDVDRLLGSSLAWFLTSIVSAAFFAVTVYVIGEAAGASTRVGVTGAAFVTALLLLPLYRVLHEWVGRLLDRERTVILARIDDFVDQVRDGQAEPEQVVPLLRSALRDPDLQLLLRLPGAGNDAYADVEGHAARPHGPNRIALVSNEVELGTIVLGTSSERRLRQARAAALKARLPIEVARLRIGLRRALEEATSSRSRLLDATTAERRRLERDLHDGAQQQIVSVGMRLRSLQSRFGPDTPAYEELDAAVEALEATVAELRRLAHGVRPSRLEDGLAPALRALVADSPIPVELSVDEVALSDVGATTAYFVIAEGLANALKHSRATRLSASIARDNGHVVVEVRDDGVGGAELGSGLASLRDRVAAAGGSLTVTSPPGGGTSIVVELACAS
jgi:signal transduction histidine kinase